MREYFQVIGNMFSKKTKSLCIPDLKKQNFYETKDQELFGLSIVGDSYQQDHEVLLNYIYFKQQ